jgi:hypothetical protein
MNSFKLDHWFSCAQIFDKANKHDQLLLHENNKKKNNGPLLLHKNKKKKNDGPLEAIIN